MIMFIFMKMMIRIVIICSGVRHLHAQNICAEQRRGLEGACV